MQEDKPKAELTQLLRSELLRFVVFRHEDKTTYGVPDTSVTGNGKTSWWEIKLANPDFKSHGQQELNMRRLANIGHFARYIIYEEIKGKRLTYIVHPKDFGEWRENAELILDGWDHRNVVAYIAEVHRV